MNQSLQAREERLERPTLGFGDRCSTNWATPVFSRRKDNNKMSIRKSKKKLYAEFYQFRLPDIQEWNQSFYNSDFK